MRCAECDCENGGAECNWIVTPTRQMPDEIIAWPADVTPGGETAMTGSWSIRRHCTDEAVRYVRADLK